MGIIEKLNKENESFVKNRNFQGVKKRFVEDYSDPAHFVYELLQNADDAKASEIEFILESKKLTVVHNGRDFNDADVEAICSIALGTKEKDDIKIGKFGIGFKSVFTYTDTPTILSGKYNFFIKELVLPSANKTFKNDAKGKTKFIIPFDGKIVNSEKAYEEILEKLKSLSDESILFLRNLKKLVVNTNDYKKIITIKYDKVDLLNIDNSTKCQKANIFIDEKEAKSFYKITRTGILLKDIDNDGNEYEVKNQNISIAVPIEKEKLITTISKNNEYNQHVFVFFPTQIENVFPFYIHAPFVTTPSRETIRNDKEANTILQDQIGKLIADSFLYFSELELLNYEIIDDLYFNDFKKGITSNLFDNIKKNFKEKLVELIKNNEKIIPCVGGKCESIKNILFTYEDPSTCKQINELFKKEDIANLYDINKNFHFSSFISDYRISYSYYYSATKYRYYDFINENNENNNIFGLHDILLNLEVEDIKSIEWLKIFVEIIIKSNEKIYSKKPFNDVDFYEVVKNAPLVRLNNGKYINGKKLDNIYIDNHSLDESLFDISDNFYTLYTKFYDIPQFSSEKKQAFDEIDRLVKLSKDYNKQKGLDDNKYSEYCKYLHNIASSFEKGNVSEDALINKKIIYAYNGKIKEYIFVYPKDVITNVKETKNVNLINLFYDVDKNVVALRENEYDNYIINFLMKICKPLIIEKYNNDENEGFNDFYQRNGCYIRISPEQGESTPFNAYINSDYINLCFNSRMSKDKSIELMKIAKDYVNDIKGIAVNCTNRNFNKNGLGYYEEVAYSIIGCYLTGNKVKDIKPWVYGKDEKYHFPSDMKDSEISEIYKDIINDHVISKLGFIIEKQEVIEKENKRLQKEGLKVIPAEDYEDFMEFKKLKDEARRKEKEAREKEKVSIIDQIKDVKNDNMSVNSDELEEFDFSSIHNTTRREENILKEIKAEEKANKEKEPSTKIHMTYNTKSSVSNEEKEFLKNEYNGKCQICGEIIKKKDGTNLFCSTDFRSKSTLPENEKYANHLAWNALCLCPNCSAKFKYSNLNLTEFWKNLDEKKIEEGNSDPIKIAINIQNEEKEVTYSPKHFQNIQAYFKYIDEKGKN